MTTAKGRLRAIALYLLVAILSGGVGFYFGFGKGANVMASLAGQNRVFDSLTDVRRSVKALETTDPALVKRKLATDLRIALVALGSFSSAPSLIKCRDQDRKALETAASYIAANPDPKIFIGDMLQERGLRFCEGSSS